MPSGLVLSPISAVAAASNLLLSLVAVAWGWLAALLAAYERTVGFLAGAGVGLLEGAVHACLGAGEPATPGDGSRARLTEGRASSAAAERALVADAIQKGPSATPASAPIAPHTPPRVLLASTGLLAPTALARTAPSSRANSVASGVSISTASLPSSHPVPLTSWAGREGPMSHPLTEEGAAPSPTADAPSSAAADAPAGPRAHSPAALTAEAVRVVSVTPLGERPAAAKGTKKRRGPLGRALHRVKRALA